MRISRYGGCEGKKAREQARQRRLVRIVAEVLRDPRSARRLMAMLPLGLPPAYRNRRERAGWIVAEMAGWPGGLDALEQVLRAFRSAQGPSGRRPGRFRIRWRVGERVEVEDHWKSLRGLWPSRVQWKGSREIALRPRPATPRPSPSQGSRRREAAGARCRADGSYLLPVWFGTNRAPERRKGEIIGFSGRDHGKLHCGRLWCAMPADRAVGSLGPVHPLWRWITGKEDRVLLHSVEVFPLQDVYWKSLRQELRRLKPDDRTAVVFIHGFRTSFSSAARRAAQLAFDLNLPGIMALFSWPSRGTTAAYPADGSTLGGSGGFLVEFLVRLVKDSGAERVHVIAHSMGNLFFARSLHDLVERAGAATRKPFGQIILAAPDIDRREFARLATLYQRAADRATLYASRYDRALKASRTVNRSDRAGLCPPLTVVDGIDTIEVSNVARSLLGHGYIADKSVLIDDIGDLLSRNLPPDDRRLRLVEQRDDQTGRRYWRMRRRK